MDYKVIAVCLGAALLSGFIHGSLGMGFGMISMAALTLFLPYNNAAAIVSAALLALVLQVSISLRKYIDWPNIIVPALTHLLGKILGIILLMHLQSAFLRIALGGFLVFYSAMQLMNVKALKIKGTPLQAAVISGLGGLFGGVFNVSGPFASIFCQARYGDDPKAYAANMNLSFVPAAIAAVIIHIGYGNFSVSAYIGSGIMVLGALASTALGISVLKKINAEILRRVSYVYIILMGLVICVSG